MARLSAVPVGMRAGLRGFWYPVLRAEELPADAPLALRRLGEDLVLWKDPSGRPRLFTDQCPHRSAPLSLGVIRGDRLECWYHGLQFDREGRCRRVPIERVDDGPHAGEFRVRTYPCEERAGYIWAYLHDGEVDVVPDLELEQEVTDPEYQSFPFSLKFDADWLTVLENALDPAHVPFLHRDAPFLPKNREQTLAWFLPSSVSSRTEVVSTPSGHGTRRAILQVASRPHGGDEVEVFYPPNLNKIPVPLPDGGEPMWSVHYHTPVDETDTMGYWYLARRVRSDEERERWGNLWNEFVGPATARIFAQDAQVCAAQVRRRKSGAQQRFLPQDGGYLRARRVLVDMYRSRHADERSASEPLPS
jgi:phenylpropionate dioxygenase-like ring-hydroxylating dioxygenase large terminal subunit